MGRETLRRHSQQAGTALADAEDAALLRVEATQEPAGALDPAQGLLVVETDGARSAGDGVRFLDGWHAVKLGLVGGWQDGQLQAPSYVAAREPAERFGARLSAEAATRGALAVVRWEGGVTGRGLAVLREVAILGDGAVWIWQLADERFADRIEFVDAFEVVDAYPAIEHLHAVVRCSPSAPASAPAVPSPPAPIASAPFRSGAAPDQSTARSHTFVCAVELCPPFNRFRTQDLRRFVVDRLCSAAALLYRASRERRHWPRLRRCGRRIESWHWADSRTALRTWT